MDNPPENNAIKIGMRVKVELQESRGNRILVEGTVKEKLTSAQSHPYGILVLLDSGIKGRVKEIINNSHFNSSTLVEFADLVNIKIPKIEDAQNEFKETFRFDVKEEKFRKEEKNNIADKIKLEIEKTDAIRMEIPITISAFGNAMGGKLFLGISKDGRIVGLERDMKKFNWKDTDELGRAIIEYLRKTIKDDVYISLKLKMIFREIDGKIIAILQSLPSIEPLYVHDGDKQDAYVRQPSAESKKMPMRDFLSYCKSRFNLN